MKREEEIREEGEGERKRIKEKPESTGVDGE
jgi:hypothetical protein